MFNTYFMLYISIVSRKCGLTRKDLVGKPKLSDVLPSFVKWVQDVTGEVKNATGKDYFPGKTF